MLKSIKQIYYHKYIHRINVVSSKNKGKVEKRDEIE